MLTWLANRPRLQRALTCLLAAGAYVLAAKVGFYAAFVHGSISAIWPPTAIALVLVYLSSYRLWPGIALGAFIANAITPVPLWVALGIAAGNTLEAVVGTWCLRRTHFLPSLQRSRDVIVLLLGAGLLSTLFSSLIGVVLLCAGGAAPWVAFAELWRVWWMGDALGNLVIAPAILTLLAKDVPRLNQQRLFEAILLTTLTAVIAGFIFFRWFDAGSSKLAWVYAVFPLVVALAMRSGQRTSTLAQALVALIAIIGTSNGYGPFMQDSLNESLLQLQVFIATMGGTCLLLAASSAEHARSEQALRVQQGKLEQTVADKTASLKTALQVQQAIHHKQLRESAINDALVQALSDIGDGLVMVEQGRIRFANPALADMTGLTNREILERESFSQLFDSADTAKIEASLAQVLLPDARPQSLDAHLLRSDGSKRDVMVALSVSPQASNGFPTIVVAMRDITDRKSQEKLLQHLATHDSLTGLPNRSLLMDRLQQALSWAARNNGRLIVVYADIDHFKSYNDTQGHAFGDGLLCAFANVLKGCVRGSDTVGRLGGDEFLMLLRDQQHEEHGLHALQRIMLTLQQPLPIDGSDWRITCSMGCAVYPKDGLQAELLLRHADLALYQAKKSGRANYQFFKPELLNR